MATKEEWLVDLDAGIRASMAGLYALTDELHERGLIDRADVANRLRRLRNADGTSMPMVEGLAVQIETGHFADRAPERPALSLAVDNDDGD